MKTMLGITKGYSNIFSPISSIEVKEDIDKIMVYNNSIPNKSYFNTVRVSIGDGNI